MRWKIIYCKDINSNLARMQTFMLVCPSSPQKSFQVLNFVQALFELELLSIPLEVYNRCQYAHQANKQCKNGHPKLRTKN